MPTLIVHIHKKKTPQTYTKSLQIWTPFLGCDAHPSNIGWTTQADSCPPPGAEEAEGVMTNHHHPVVLSWRIVMLMVRISFPQCFPSSGPPAAAWQWPLAPGTQKALVC